MLSAASHLSSQHGTRKGGGNWLQPLWRAKLLDLLERVCSASDRVIRQRKKIQWTGARPCPYTAGVGELVPEWMQLKTLDSLNPSHELTHSSPDKRSSFGFVHRFPKVPFEPLKVLGPLSGGLNVLYFVWQRRSPGGCHRLVSGFLQLPLPSGEVIRGLETSHRSLSSERVYPTNHTQDGDSLSSSEIYQGGRLHGLDRPEGCLFPGTEPFHQASWKYLHFICQGTTYRVKVLLLWCLLKLLGYSPESRLQSRVGCTAREFDYFPT